MADARRLEDAVEVVDVGGAAEGVDDALVVVEGARGEDLVIILMNCETADD